MDTIRLKDNNWREDNSFVKCVLKGSVNLQRDASHAIIWRFMYVRNNKKE